MNVAYIGSQSLSVAAKLGIADLLVDGPRNVESLAAATGTHEPSLYRVMRLLAAADPVFSLTLRLPARPCGRRGR
jgi:hypothetical protein